MFMDLHILRVFQCARMFQSSHLFIKLLNAIAYVKHSKKRDTCDAIFVPYLCDSQAAHETKACVFDLSGRI